MPAERVMILAGTDDARVLANAFVDQGVDVISSFAGVTRQPRLPRGRIRTGGFGGVDGLAEVLRDEGITRLVDATHPFAAQMSFHAAGAAALAGVPLLRLERAQWVHPQEGAWRSVPTLDDAPAAVPAQARVLITTGRRGLAGFFARKDLTGLIRTIEPPDDPLPPGWRLLLDRPPFDADRERDLLTREGITCLVSKNSGGAATWGKIAAAQAMGMAIVMVARPAKPAVETVGEVTAALAWVRRSPL